MRYVVEMEKEEGERIAAMGGWSAFNSLDHVPIVGEIARLGQTITAAIQGDSEQVKEAATNLGYNLAADSIGLVTDGLGRAAGAVGRTVSRTTGAEVRATASAATSTSERTAAESLHSVMNKAEEAGLGAVAKLPVGASDVILESGARLPAGAENAELTKDDKPVLQTEGAATHSETRVQHRHHPRNHKGSKAQVVHGAQVDVMQRAPANQANRRLSAPTELTRAPTPPSTYAGYSVEFIILISLAAIGIFAFHSFSD